MAWHRGIAALRIAAYRNTNVSALLAADVGIISQQRPLA